MERSQWGIPVNHIIYNEDVRKVKGRVAEVLLRREQASEHVGKQRPHK